MCYYSHEVYIVAILKHLENEPITLKDPCDKTQLYPSNYILRSSFPHFELTRYLLISCCPML